MTYALSSILVPIFVVVVLPICIVWIVFHSSNAQCKMRTDIIMESVRNNPNTDPEKISKMLNPETKEDLAGKRLLRGCIFTLIGLVILAFGFICSQDSKTYLLAGISLAVGISYLIVYFVSKRERANKDTQEIAE